MKKNQIIYMATAMLLAGGLLASCGNKKADSAQEETAQQTVEEATREAFEVDQKDTAADSVQQDTLQQIDQMVEAVESPVNGINGTKYDAAFFNNPANKASKASADKYVQTSTGLKYVIATPGKGASPKATDTVTVHYVGTLTDGSQFDSSIDRGEPIAFPLSGVIPGWTEGLQYMQEGSTAVFYIPSQLAYGQRNLPGIPANSDLIFWVQLLQVN